MLSVHCCWLSGQCLLNGQPTIFRAHIALQSAESRITPSSHSAVVLNQFYSYVLCMDGLDRCGVWCHWCAWAVSTFHIVTDHDPQAPLLGTLLFRPLYCCLLDEARVPILCRSARISLSQSLVTVQLFWNRNVKLFIFPIKGLIANLP